MKKLAKDIMIAFLVVVCLSCLCSVQPSAAATRKCYTISSGNTTVYSNTGLTKRYGTIYGSDEITVITVTSRYTKVSYPISGGRTKTGYIRTSDILLGTGGNSYRSQAKIETYKRPGGTSYGYIASGDQVMVLGKTGNYIQVKYPVSTGYKYAFINNNNNKNETYYVTTKVGLCLRKSASISGAKITTMPYAAAVNVHSISNGWAYLTYNGKTGYASTQYLSKTLPPSPSPTPTTGLGSPVPSGCKFSKKTSDGGFYCYHDINRNVSTSTPVYAIADGIVTYKQAYRTYSGVKYLTSYGNFIELKTSDGVYTAKYCHLSRFVGADAIISRTKRANGSTGVYTIKSKNVRKGEIIGYIGTTGNSTGPHLHFEIRKNGTRIDPTSVIGGLT